jgi:hypothetical protein
MRNLGIQTSRGLAYGMKLLIVVVFLMGSAVSIDNGLGRKPPMGWRSWNCYHQAISQEKMTIAANAMVNKSRGASLLELGYENCGLDDYYQACGTGVNGSFHNASGYPLIDHTKFPDMKAMTDHVSFLWTPFQFTRDSAHYKFVSPFVCRHTLLGSRWAGVSDTANCVHCLSLSPLTGVLKMATTAAAASTRTYRAGGFPCLPARPTAFTTTRARSRRRSISASTELSSTDVVK